MLAAESSAQRVFPLVPGITTDSLLAVKNDNPLRNSPYDASQDPLVNPLSTGYTEGWLADDPDFPEPPAGTTFTEPVRNYGTAADFYRDPVTGNVKKCTR